MAAFFLDSSAVAKRYLVETGSAWILSQVDPGAGNVLYVAEIPGVEVVSALARRERGGGLSSPDADSAIGDLRHDLRH